MLEQMFMTLMEGAVCVGTPFILHLCKNMFSSWVIELDLSFWRSATVNKLSQENTAKSMIKTDQEFRTNLFNCLELQRKNSFSAIRFQSYCHLLSTHTSSIAEQMWCDQSYLSVAKLENSTHISLESVGISPPAYICTSPYSELKDLYPHFKTASSFSAVAEVNLQCDLSNISHNLRKDTSGYSTSSDTGPEVDSKMPSCDQTQCGVNELDMSITDCVYNQDGQLVQMFICFDIEHSDTSSAVSSSDSGCKNWDSDCEDFIVFESSCTDEGHCCARFDFVCSETKPEITKRSGDHKESFMKSVVLSSNLYCEVTVRESFDDKLDIFVQEMLQPNLCYSCEELILNKKCTKEAETNKSGDSTVKTASQDKRKKKVCFKPDHELVVVHPMIVWSFAYRQARKGTWEVDALDRHRFQKRIEEVDKILTPVLLAKIEEVNLSII